MTFKLSGIGARLAAGFGFMLVLMVGLTVVSISEVNRLDRNLTEINEVNSRLQRYAINFRGSVHDRAIAIRDVVLVEDPGARDAAVALIADLAATYAENERAMEALASEVGLADAERAILDDIAAVQAATNPLVAEIVSLQRAGEADAARAILLQEVSGLFSDWLAAINRFIDAQEAKNLATGAEVSASAAGFQTLALVALLVAAGLAVATAALVGRSVTRPVNGLVGVMQRLAAGETMLDIPHAERRDEVGDMARALETFRAGLADKQRLEAEQVEAEQRAQEEKRRATRALADKFERSVGQVVQQLAGSAGQLEQAAQTMSGTSEQTIQQAESVGAAQKRVGAEIGADQRQLRGDEDLNRIGGAQG